MPVETPSLFAQVIRDHLELKERNSDLDRQMPIERYKSEKEPIMAKADKLEKESAEAEAKSEAAMHTHHRWAQALTLIQIAIALAAITILTRQKPMGVGALGVAIASIVLGLLAAAHI